MGTYGNCHLGQSRLRQHGWGSRPELVHTQMSPPGNQKAEADRLGPHSSLKNVSTKAGLPCPVPRQGLTSLRRAARCLSCLRNTGYRPDPKNPQTGSNHTSDGRVNQPSFFLLTRAWGATVAQALHNPASPRSATRVPLAGRKGCVFKTAHHL